MHGNSPFHCVWVDFMIKTDVHIKCFSSQVGIKGCILDKRKQFEHPIHTQEWFLMIANKIATLVNFHFASLIFLFNHKFPDQKLIFSNEKMLCVRVCATDEKR